MDARAQAEAARKRPLKSPRAANQVLAYRALMGHDPPPPPAGLLVWQWTYRGGKQRLEVARALGVAIPQRRRASR